MDSAAVRLPPSTRCPYTSLVIAMPPAVSSNPSSNAAVRSQTTPHRPPAEAAGQETARTGPDGLSRDRARL